mmetsp:Transcript_115436/g.326269  ORF Transcript_115436/g.326269 Transcript_115436/m.326269 type:complete len:277 (-) Transcript_115436:1202-2032(-)
MLPQRRGLRGVFAAERLRDRGGPQNPGVRRDAAGVAFGPCGGCSASPRASSIRSGQDTGKVGVALRSQVDNGEVAKSGGQQLVPLRRHSHRSACYGHDCFRTRGRHRVRGHGGLLGRGPLVRGLACEQTDVHRREETSWHPARAAGAPAHCTGPEPNTREVALGDCGALGDWRLGQVPAFGIPAMVSGQPSHRAFRGRELGGARPCPGASRGGGHSGAAGWRPVRGLRSFEEQAWAWPVFRAQRDGVHRQACSETHKMYVLLPRLRPAARRVHQVA